MGGQHWKKDCRKSVSYTHLIVATFLAVLELSKTRRIRLEGDGEDIELTLTNNKGE